MGGNTISGVVESSAARSVGAVAAMTERKASTAKYFIIREAEWG